MGTSQQLPLKLQLTQSNFARKILGTTGLLGMLAIIVFFLIVIQRSGNPRTLRAGDVIPVAALRAVDPGDTLIAGIEGRRAAIFFFSADCPRCQQEIPIFNEAWKQFTPQVQVIAIILNDRKKSEAFAHANDIKANVLVDERGVVGVLFGVSELPAFFLVNQEQRVEWVGEGEQPKAELFRRLSRLAGSGLSSSVRAGR